MSPLPQLQVFSTDCPSSESDFEARERSKALEETVQKILDQNHSLLRRLEEFEFLTGNEGTFVRFYDDDQSSPYMQHSIRCPRPREQATDVGREMLKVTAADMPSLLSCPLTPIPLMMEYTRSLRAFEEHSSDHHEISTQDS